MAGYSAVAPLFLQEGVSILLLSMKLNVKLSIKIVVDFLIHIRERAVFLVLHFFVFVFSLFICFVLFDCLIFLKLDLTLMSQSSGRFHSTDSL